MNIKKVAIYIRVSTLDQVENGYSLQAQINVLTKWISERGYTLYQIYEDRGISGKNISARPKMVQLLDDAQKQSFDIVLVWALSRLTRSVSDLYNTCELLNRNNIELISYTESFDTSTPTGRAMMGILGVFAQMEREMTAERVKAAMLERAIQGKRTCNEILGYNIIEKDEFEINEAEATIIRYIFSEYQKRKNYSEVARKCIEHNYKGKRGRQFKAEHIKQILGRTVYAGYNSYLGKAYKGNYHPIIPLKEFNKVQRLIKKPILGVMQ